MFRSEFKCAADVGLPLRHGLPGKAEHQVDAYVGYACVSQVLYGSGGLSGSVAAVEEAQALIGKCLHAHAYAVDWHTGQLAG